jgi:4-alpha-glucanotransferase
LPIIAEDLGVITPEVDQLRDDFGFPGMRVLQFAFGGDANDLHLPHNYHQNVVAYTGTHDNDTTVGWFHSAVGADSTRTETEINSEREFCKKYLHTQGEEIEWDFIRAVLSSVANTAIIPLQEVLGVGSEGRMNLPNSTEGNWSWRFAAGALTDAIQERLQALSANLRQNSEERGPIIRGIMTMDDTPGFVLAFDLGGTHLRAALIDEDGAIHSRCEAQDAGYDHSKRCS